MILPYLHERRIYLNRRHTANQFYTLIEHEGQNFVLCICIQDKKMNVYSETGILIARHVYRELADKIGKPESISENGQFLLFRTS